MIPYDVTLQDVEYYWAGSILLWERKGIYTPVTISLRGEPSEYPVCLTDAITGNKVVNVTTSTLIEKCLVHFPPMGYADLSGLPVYLSPRAGQGKLKGIDINNVVAFTPVDVITMSGAGIERLSNKLRLELRTNPDASMSTSDSTKMDKYRRMYEQLRAASSGTPCPTLPRMSTKMLCKLVAQSVNNIYTPLKDVMKKLQHHGVAGVSISRNCCIINAGGHKRVLYHKLTPVGTVDDALRVTLHPNVSSSMATCLRHVVPLTILG